MTVMQNIIIIRINVLFECLYAVDQLSYGLDKIVTGVALTDEMDLFPKRSGLFSKRVQIKHIPQLAMHNLVMSIRIKVDHLTHLSIDDF
jgi:hypothetical protein